MALASKSWLRVAGVSGASAVILGTYGAHAFHPEDNYYLHTFETANKYHFVHSLLIGLAPSARRPLLVGSLATAGIALFCGSLYATALTEDNRNSKLAPTGGVAFIAAWLSLVL